MNSGNRPDDQSNRPASAITPAMEVPWPPRNLVAECRAMSAPWSRGRHRYGVAKVESTARGSLWARATSARASTSATAPDGLAMISVYSSLVSGRTAAAKAHGSVPSTKVVSMPRRRRVTSNWV